MREDGRNKANPRRASNHRAFQAHPPSNQRTHREHKLQRERLRLRQFLSLHLHRLSKNKTSLLRSRRIRLRNRTSPRRKLRQKPKKPPQSFDHIFELTQGNLESPGFVIINGPPGAGKTTLCSGLTANYLKRGDPCLYVTYDQAPTTLREQIKKLGSDPSQYESQYRFIIVDGYASQSDSFSMEATYLDQPFNFENIQDTLVRNSQVFTGEKIRVIFDSIDKLATKVPQKDFVKSFTELAGKLKDSGATLIVTVDMSQLPKDLAGSLTDMADCVADLSKDDSDPNERELKVQRINQKSAKIDAE